MVTSVLLLGGGNHQFVGLLQNGVGTTALGTYTKRQLVKTSKLQLVLALIQLNQMLLQLDITPAGKITEGGVALGRIFPSITGRIVGYNPNDGRTKYI